MDAHFLRRIVCIAIIAVLVWQAPVTGAARAGMVTTETVLQSERAAPAGAEAAGRDRLRAFLRRQDVRAQLTALGVDPAEAAARVESLSDAEVAPLVARFDSLPAGAGGPCEGTATATECAVYGGAVVIMFIFLVLIVVGLIWLVYLAVSAVTEDDEPPTQTASPRVSKSNKSKPAIQGHEIE